MAKLRGSWRLVYWLYDGKEPPESAGEIVLSVAAEEFAIRTGSVVTEGGALEGLDSGRSPKAFDYAPTIVEGRPVRLRFPGIYLLQGDVFLACVGYGGMRPKAFSAEAGSNNELVIYKRVGE